MQLEFDFYITPDGQTHNLHDFEARALIGSSDYGMPPICWDSRRGPYQHGATPELYRLEPRIVQLVVRWMARSREDYWTGRSLILDIFRPNRSDDLTPGQLRKVLPDGSIRDLDVFVLEGPPFKIRDPQKWEEWSFEEIVRLIAYEPSWYDPTEMSYAALTTEAELVFPIDPFILFGPMTALHIVGNLTNVGSWRAWPTIQCVGPLNSPQLTNNTIDELIKLNYEILGGRTVTIDLTPGRKTVEDDLGNNLLAYISEDSDLTTWRLEVDPIAPGGVNEIDFIAGGIQVGQSAVNVSWRNRYIGI